MIDQKGLKYDPGLVDAFLLLGHVDLTFQESPIRMNKIRAEFIISGQCSIPDGSLRQICINPKKGAAREEIAWLF